MIIWKLSLNIRMQTFVTTNRAVRVCPVHTPCKVLISWKHYRKIAKCARGRLLLISCYDCILYKKYEKNIDLQYTKNAQPVFSQVFDTQYDFSISQENHSKQRTVVLNAFSTKKYPKNISTFCIRKTPASFYLGILFPKLFFHLTRKLSITPSLYVCVPDQLHVPSQNAVK